MTSTSPPLTFRAAAEHVLDEAGIPLLAAAITERALAAGLVSTGGSTPSATMEAQLATSIQQQGEASPFIRVAPRTYALRRWLAEGRIAPPTPESANDVRIVAYPEYDEVRTILPVLAGMRRADVTGLRAAIWEHRGTPTETVDWTEPDRWIAERLTGEYRAAALRIWMETNHRVNPRHMAGHWLLASGYALLTDGPNGTLQISDRGRDFVEEPEGTIVRELDEREGLLGLLALLAEQGPAQQGELLPSWMAFLRPISRIRAETTGRSFLYRRLRNLLARGYAARVGQSYEITPAGLEWLKRSGFAERKTTTPDETRRLWDLVQAQKGAVRRALRERLGTMEPYAFEQLTGRLLEAMGYTDVEVTDRAGDKGVDVVGRITLGITEVREVVQVKRQQGNVQRPVLDMLRGSLHRFGAVKGTIIALGGFSKGARDAAFEPGVAPITLIDGEKLLDLLIEHGVGVQTKRIELLELDETTLLGSAEGADDAEA